MRATGYKLVKRRLISTDFLSVTTAFETALKYYSKFQVCLGKDGSKAYWIKHEVSTDEIWDCGLIVVRQLHTAPAELKKRLHLEEISKDDLQKWTEVVIVESTNIAKEAQNHQEIIANEAFAIFPPSIFIWSAKVEDLRVKSILARYADEDWIDPEMEVIPQISGVVAVPIEEKPKRGRGRPPLDTAVVDEWCRIVQRANDMRIKNPLRPWKEIAYELGVSERSLRYWRSDPRCR